jgi:hypothetical protein
MHKRDLAQKTYERAQNHDNAALGQIGHILLHGVPNACWKERKEADGGGEACQVILLTLLQRQTIDRPLNFLYLKAVLYGQRKTI